MRESLLTERQHHGRMRTVKHKPVSEQLREAVRRAGCSQNAIARRAKLDRGALSRFMSGERGLRLDAVDALARELGMRLMPASRNGSARRGRAP
jgi:transcriptional regulator with XRE-family HTH domain